MHHKANLITWFLLCGLLLMDFSAAGQEKKYIVEYPEGVNLFSSSDSVTIARQLKDYLHLKQGEGYFLVDYKIKSEGYKVLFVIEEGQQFEWAKISKGNLPQKFLGDFSFEQKFESGNPFSKDQIERLLKNVIRRSENSGYPFASVRLDSISIEGTQFSARINYSPGPFIAFDSLNIINEERVNKKWLASYLNIRKEDPYNQDHVDQISGKIAALPFFSLVADPYVTFQNEQAIVYLNIKYQPVNKFDAVIGFGQGREKKLLITGKANIELHNLFNRAHHFLLEWNRIRSETQELILDYEILNVLYLPFNIGGHMDLFRKDTSFFNSNLKLQVGFTKNRVSTGAFIRNFRSIKLSNDQDAQIKDINVNYFGLAVEYVKIDNFLTPTEGLVLSTSFAVGNKDIKNISGINDKSTQLNFMADISKYSTFSSGYLSNTLKIEGILNKNLYENDLVRVGGINSIRGFPESYFYVSQYYISLNEYHWTFNDGSSFFVLADGGYIKENNLNLLYSMGLGFDLRVNNGIFELIYALGKEEGTSLSFDNSVLHFGFRTVF